MSDLVLHDFALDEGCYAVRLFLALLDVPCTLVAVDMVPGAEHRRAPFLHLNPLGTLPVLEDRGVSPPLVLREAGAILAALARDRDAGATWLPAAPADFGAVMAWLVFAARDLDAAVRARRHALWGEAADGPSLAAATRTALRARDDHMTERGFGGGLWFVGDRPTIADIALFPAFALSRDGGIEHEAYPALRGWMRRIRALPGFVAMPGIPDYA